MVCFLCIKEKKNEVYVVWVCVKKDEVVGQLVAQIADDTSKSIAIALSVLLFHFYSRNTLYAVIFDYTILFIYDDGHPDKSYYIYVLLNKQSLTT